MAMFLWVFAGAMKSSSVVPNYAQLRRSRSPAAGLLWWEILWTKVSMQPRKGV